MPFIRQKLGLDAKHPATKSEFTQLSDHVNHTQTEILHKQTEILEQIDRKAAEIVEGTKALQRKHEEWEKYGIKARCDKKRV